MFLSKTNKLCVSCNKEAFYYPKSDKITNSFINCYQNPNGYYLDNDIYRPCYSTCKKCYGPGDSNDHNCSQCINDDDILISDFSGVIFDFTFVFNKPIIYA